MAPVWQGESVVAVLNVTGFHRKNPEFFSDDKGLKVGINIQNIRNMFIL